MGPEFLEFAIENFSEMFGYINTGRINIRIHRDVTGLPAEFFGGSLFIYLKDNWSNIISLKGLAMITITTTGIIKHKRYFQLSMSLSDIVHRLQTITAKNNKKFGRNPYINISINGILPYS